MNGSSRWSPYSVTLIIVVVLAFGATGCSTQNPYFDPEKPHHTTAGFRNPDGLDKPGFARFLSWQWARLRDGLPAQDADQVPRQALDPALLLDHREGVRMTWLGHASLLLQLGKTNLLLDPVFSERASPFRFLGPRRQVPLPIAPDQLPPIHLVLISHNHYDHLDEASVRRLARQPSGPPVFLVPLGVEAWFAAKGIPGAVAMDWGDQVTERGLNIHFTPAHHWSRRSLWDTNQSLWGGFLIDAQRKEGLKRSFRLFYAGDTGYASLFSELGQKFPGIDWALLPVGCYEPRWFMGAQHADPHDAVRIFRDLGARQALGVHWAGFRLCDEPVEQPLIDLPKALVEAGLTSAAFQLWAVGESRLISP